MHVAHMDLGIAKEWESHFEFTISQSTRNLADVRRRIAELETVPPMPEPYEPEV